MGEMAFLYRDPLLVAASAAHIGIFGRFGFDFARLSDPQDVVAPYQHLSKRAGACAVHKLLGSAELNIHVEID